MDVSNCLIKSIKSFNNVKIEILTVKNNPLVYFADIDDLKYLSKVYISDDQIDLFRNSKNNRIEKKNNNFEFIKSFDLITTVTKLNNHLSICHLKIHFLSKNILFNLNGNDDITNFLMYCKEHIDGDIGSSHLDQT